MPLPRIESLKPYVPGLTIDEIRDKYNLRNIIKLASNENPLGASPLVQDAIARYAPFSFRYPQGGNPRLAAAIAARHGVSPRSIAIGNGSDEIIDILIRIFAQSERHNIVCFDPCFSIYPIQATINGNMLRRAPLAEDFTFDFSALLNLVDAATRLVFITTPDNPSGFCPARENIAEFAASLARQAPQAYLVIDEAYMDFAEDEKRLSLLASHNIPANAIFLRTFSKSYGLAGLRLGYAVMPESVADLFWRVRLPFSVNILAEEAGLAALEDEAFRKATLETVSQGRNFLASGLAGLGCTVWPSAANFLLFKLPPGSLAAGQCHEALLKEGIIIRPLGSYGMDDYLRVSVGNPRENGIFLNALAKIIGERSCQSLQ